MTFREKLKEEYPGKINENCAGGCEGCPSQYGYEERYDCKNVTCKDCWNREMPLKCPNSTRMMNREMPNTEPLTDNERKIDFMSENAYNKGLNDAWELADKFNNMAMSEIIKVLGIDISREEVFDAVYPQEALAKLKAYEEAQEIKVGDVVTNEERNVEILVTEIDDYERTFNGIKVTPTDKLGNLGGVYTAMLMCKFTKTGKHLDIQSILEQIGE